MMPSMWPRPFLARHCNGAFTTVPGNNGNMLAQTINGAGRVYSYDGVSRLCRSVQGATWTETYAYDTRGNLGVSRSGALPAVTDEVIGSIGAYAANNRVSSWAYDQAGNVAGIPTAAGSTHREPCATGTMPGTAMLRTACYDAENRMVSETDASGATATYTYDGDGRRISKTVSGVTTTFVYDPMGQLAQEYGGPTISGSETGTRYLTTDQLGSTRLVTDGSGNVAQSYDYLPFGQDFTLPTDSNRIRFTSKERDAETGLDYFGARYMSSAQGRFTSSDPLMASAHASNPQSWNRYAYALNNPLRFTDPNGMDVPAACAEDKNCQIVVKVNVVYDKTVHDGKGLTNKERQTFEKNQLQQAQKDFGNSNIKLNFTYTQGSYTVENGQTQLTGLKSDSLNLVVSTANANREAGVSGLAGNGAAVSFLNFNDVNNSNVGPLWSNTTEHEMGHQFLGDPQTGRTPGFFEHMGRDMRIDTGNTLQGLGASQSGYRQGLEPRVYAVPANPEANKPQK